MKSDNGKEHRKVIRQLVSAAYCDLKKVLPDYFKAQNKVQYVRPRASAKFYN